MTTFILVNGEWVPKPPRPKPPKYDAQLYLPAKSGAGPDGLTKSRRLMSFPDEDYADSVCLLLPYGQATLIDTTLFPWASQIPWQVLGRLVYHNQYFGGLHRRRGVTIMTVLHRSAITHGLDSCASPNVTRRMLTREVDHANRNPWDNRQANLRLATRSQNAHNKPGRSNATSRFKGVHWSSSKGRWLANVRLRGKTYRLGSFTDEVQAAMAYNRFIKDRCPEFGYLNPIMALPTDDPPPIKPRRRRSRKSVA